MRPLTFIPFVEGAPKKSWRVIDQVEKRAFAPEQIKLLSIGADEFGGSSDLPSDDEGRIDPAEIAKIVPKKQGVNLTYCVWLAVQLAALVMRFL